MRRQDWALYTETLARVLFGDMFPPEVLAGMSSYLRSCVDQRTLITAYETIERYDVTQELQRVDVQTLVVFNQHNKFLAPSSSQRLASTIPQAEFRVLDDITYLSLPDLVAEWLGEEPAKALPGNKLPDNRAVQTILFTDLVGHTEMMRRLGDERGREVLREHERITRDLLKQHGGAEVKTMGDGFMASFGSVTRAMDCAIALQRAFAAHEGEPLAVRVGLNAGEPIEEDGDLFGSTVIMASRIAAKAGAGEILIPEPLRHLLTGKSYVYADRGETILKGFEDAVRIYEVHWREPL
jgi:class 3 adenylate cyclase